MTFQGDPHRALGIPPTASLNEIKSAYRRLVKQYHPDAAGERALPRFLAIQAAYERLVDGEGRLRPPGPPPKSGRGAGNRPQESWRADPNRARASRDAWRAKRSGSGGTTTSSGSGARSSTPGAGADPKGPDPADSGTSAGEGYTWTRSGPRTRRERTHREHRPRRATPGSTSYDEAAELPLDPEWDGGAWYGPSSGTFWTINPREYADPRKHGPEYLARARRAVRGERRAAGEPLPDEELGDEPDEPIDGDAAWSWSASAPGTAGPGASTTGGGADWGTRSWRYDDVPPVDTPGERQRNRAHAGTEAASTDAEPLPDLESIARRFAPLHLLALARAGDHRWRLVLALVGWLPIGYAIGTLISTLTGCAALSPSCPEPMTMLPIAVQPLVIAGLFLLPPAAAVAAFAVVVALAVALPVAAVLSVGTGPGSRVGAPVLGAFVVVAYLVGLAWGANAVWRAPAPPADDGGAAGAP